MTNVTPFQSAGKSHVTYMWFKECVPKEREEKRFVLSGYLPYDHRKRQVIPLSRRIPKQEEIKNGAILLHPHLAAFS